MILKKNYKLWLLSSLLICLVSVCAKGQSVAETDSIANHYYTHSNYQQAFLTYKRLLFFGDSIHEAFYCSRLAVCSEHIGDNKNAAYYYKRLRYLIEDDSIYTASILKEYQCLLISDLPMEVLSSSASINSSLFAENQKIRLYFYLGLAYVKSGYPDSAISIFRNLSASASIEDSAVLQEVITSYQKDISFNPDKIKRLSLFLPGLGQFVLKDYKNAANSFALNTLLIGGMVITSIQLSVIDGVLFWGSFVRHYYVGGAQAAHELATKKKVKLGVEYYDRFVTSFSRAQFTRIPSH